MAGTDRHHAERQLGRRLLAVAESQLGYEQSERNFQLDDADGETVRHYTRYGNDYGNDYGPWDVMFLSYCLKYADIPQSAIPQVSSVLSLHSQLRSALYNEETGSGYAMDLTVICRLMPQCPVISSFTMAP